MRFLLTLFFCALTYAQEPCCAPNQFEGFISAVTAVVNISEQVPQPYISRFRNAIATDFLRDKVATGIDGVRVILDSRENRRYVIQPDLSCEYFPFYDSIAQCMPAFATHLRSSYFGLGDHRLDVDDWTFLYNGTFDLEVSVLASNCAPVTTHFAFDTDSQVYVLGYYRYDRLQGVIQDPGVFDPPEGCQPAPPSKAGVSQKGLPLGYLLTQHMTPKQHPNIKLKDILGKNLHDLI